MPLVQIRVPGLPKSYDGTSLASLKSYVHDAAEFLSQHLASSVCLSHPNHLAISYGAGSVEHELRSDWWEYLDVLDQGEQYLEPLKSSLSVPSNGGSRSQVDRLKELVSSAQLPADAPSSLRAFVKNIRDLELDRLTQHQIPPVNDSNHTTLLSTSSGSILKTGMSPKKSHEVERLSSVIRNLARSSDSLTVCRNIVDIGAGQGYLSRELSSSPAPSDAAKAFEVLALESDEGQLAGASKRQQAAESSSPRGSVTYKNIFVSDTQSLKNAVDVWLEDSHDGDGENRQEIPVAFTGLHACGSLTPTVLRAFTTFGSRREQGTQRWCSDSLALVGCCYNLLHPFDFPLSSALKTSSDLKLDTQHLQLACQCPYQWTISEQAWADSKLARRKIVYRALLGRVVSRLLNHPVTQTSSDPPTDRIPIISEASGQARELDEGRAATGRATLAGMRLGRLNARDYVDWPTFLGVALRKLSTLPDSPLANLPVEEVIACAETSLVDVAQGSPSYPGVHVQSESGAANDDERRKHYLDAVHIPPELPGRLGALHVLRAFVGPLIESLIIVDRILFLVESLQQRQLTVHEMAHLASDTQDGTKGAMLNEGTRQWTWRVSALNVFALESGSARNVALLAERVPLSLDA